MKKKVYCTLCGEFVGICSKKNFEDFERNSALFCKNRPHREMENRCNKCGREIPKDQEWCLKFTDFGDCCGGKRIK